MSDIKWEDPPRNGAGAPGGRWVALVAELKKRPGEWACVSGTNPATATYLKTGRLGGTQRGEIEAVTRNTRTVDGARVSDVYARYVGNGSNGDKP